MWRIVAVLCALLCLATLPVFAAARVLSCCDMPEPITSCCCACTIAQGTWTGKIDWRSGSTSSFLVGGRSAADPMNREMDMWVRSSTIKYGIRDHIMLRLFVPQITKEMHMTMGGQPIERRGSGLGDATAVLKYRLNSPIGSAPMFAVGAGLKLDTGKDDASDSVGELPPKMQSGTGTTEPLLGVWVSRKILPWTFHAGYMYRFGRLNGRTGFHRGDAVMSNWTAAYILNDKINFLMELNFRHLEKDVLNGALQQDSGGTILFASPGIQYKSKDGSVWEAALQLPVIHKLHGAQMKPPATFMLGGWRAF